MYNPEMGMGIPQELKERPLEDNLEKNENQETAEALIKEFQEEEKEKLFLKESKEKTPKSRLKKALCAITAGLILFGSAEAGFAGVAGVKDEGKTKYTQENAPVSIKNQIIEKEASITDQVEITPEFQRNMEKVLLSIPSNGLYSLEEIRKIYQDLLVKMPNYSIIQALVGKGQEENFKKIIDEIQEQEKGINLLTINNWVNKIKIVYLRQMRRHGGEKIRSCIRNTAKIFSPNGKQMAQRDNFYC